MHYRLLRNNKESGPYTALQLQEMGLKPYDLLWAEGRGAAWQYASELPDLKAFAPVVEEQPFDRFYKKDEPKNSAKENVAAAKKTKPRFRISGDKIIMVEAGNMEVATNGSIQTATQSRFVKEPPVEEKVATQPHWQEIYEEWGPQPHKKVAIKEEPVEVETKYSESLDDLKKKYAEKVLNEKAEAPYAFKSVSLKQNIMAAAALLVLAVGGYIGYTLKQKDRAKTNASAVVERADVGGDNTLASQQNSDNTVADNAQNNPVANNSVNKSNGKVNAATPSIQNPVAKNETEKKEVTKPSSKEELKIGAKTNETTGKPSDKTVALNEKKKEALTTTNSVSNNNKPAAQTDANTTAKNTTGNNTITPPVATPVVKQNVPKKIEDYVAVKKIGGSGSTVENVRLLVNNVTDFPIDLAVIDVQYFDSKGKFQKGETMYVKNIDGGNNVEVRVPDSDKSSSIKYKVSLVSSEKKTLYLVAD